MSDLLIDFKELTTAVARIENVRDIFETSHADASVAADHAGHTELAGKVRDFADKWDVKRGKMRDGIVLLSEHYRAVVDTMTDLDTSMGSKLRESAEEASRQAGQAAVTSPGSGVKVGKASGGDN